MIPLLFALWRASWQGAVVVGVIWCLSRLLARRLPPAWRCTLWRLPYVKLLLGLLIAGGVMLPLRQIAPWEQQVRPKARGIDTPVTVPFASTPVLPSRFPASDAVGMPPARKEGAALGSARPLSWLAILSAAYLLGLGVCLSRLLHAGQRMRRILRAASPVEDASWQAELSGLAARLAVRRVPLLMASPLATVPFYAANRIILPADGDYPPVSLQLILAHELAHARRCDLLFEWLSTAIYTLFFFHPLVLLARREERLARESAADALAVQATGAAPGALGELLLELAVKPRSGLLGAVGVVEGGAFLRRRIVALQEVSPMKSKSLRPRPLILLLSPTALLALIPFQIAPPPNLPGARRTPHAPNPYTLRRSPLVPRGDKSIVGQIRDDQGNPVAGVDVSASLNLPSPKKGVFRFAPVGTVLADDQGHFTIIGLPAGTFTLDIRIQSEPFDAGMGDTKPSAFLRSHRNASVTLKPEDTQKTVDFVLSRGVTVSGQVFDKATGKPIHSFHIWARNVDTVGKEGFGSIAATDADGRYLLRLPPGRVSVGPFGNRTEDIIDDLPVIGQDAEHDFRVTAPLPSARHGITTMRTSTTPSPRMWAPRTERTGIATGDHQMNVRICDEAGHPLAGLQVTMGLSQLVEAQAPGPRQTLEMARVTGSDGRVVLDHLPAGHYSMGFLSLKREYVAEGYYLDLKVGEPVKSLDWTALRGVLVTGKVTDKSTGRPMSHIHVAGRSREPHGAEGPWAFAAALTDATGMYALRLPPGRILVTSEPVQHQLRALPGNRQSKMLDIPKGQSGVQDFTLSSK